MKYKIGTLLKMHESGSLKKLLNADLDVDDALQLQELAAAVESDIIPAQRVKFSLLQKFGKDKGNGVFEITNVDKYNEEFEKLSEKDLELPNVELKVEKLKEAGVKLSANDLIVLKNIIKL